MQANLRRWSLVILMCLSSVGAACAADGAWNVESGGNWSDGSNWKDGVVAEGAGNTAYFTNAPSVFNRPAVALDTNLFLNGMHLWQGDVSLFTIAAERVPGTLDYYSIDIGSADFNVYASCPLDFKAELKGTGAVRFSGLGLFSFCHYQSFAGPLYLGNRSAYKGINYRTYAHSAATTTDDMLATAEVYTDFSTLTLIGRYPRAASSGRSWELIPGGSHVRLLDSGVNVGNILAPGQTVTGEHVRDGTFIQSIRDSVTIYLNQTLADDFSETVTQTLAFAAAPRWDVVQQFDRLVSQSSDATATSGVQFRPCVAGGYGTNTVTLRVGELAGNRPVRVTVDTVQGGSDGRLLVDRAETFTQNIILENTAALLLGDQETIPTAPALNAAFWVDASEEASLTKDMVGNITRWNDKRGAGYPSAESWINTPEYMANALNGLPVVDFGPLGSNRGLAWDREITGIKVVFWVMGSQDSGGTLLGSKPGYTTDYRRGFDALRAIGNTDASYVILLSNGLVGYNPVAGDYVAVNGREVALAGCGLSGGYDLVTVSLPSKSYKASAFAFDAYDAAGTRFSGGQRLAEVIVYTNVLSAQQIKDTEAYLYKKWFDRDAFGYGAGKVDFMATATGSDARIGQAGTQPVEARHVSHQGNLTVMS
ncbi:MAG: hypothetical protein PHU80_11680, partial [Kiritimatiellae bacterium]|nr:hypothetical protein [Kiritimatiellia bacterium]